MFVGLIFTINSEYGMSSRIPSRAKVTNVCYFSKNASDSESSCLASLANSAVICHIILGQQSVNNSDIRFFLLLQKVRFTREASLFLLFWMEFEKTEAENFSSMRFKTLGMLLMLGTSHKKR